MRCVTVFRYIKKELVKFKMHGTVILTVVLILEAFELTRKRKTREVSKNLTAAQVENFNHSVIRVPLFKISTNWQRCLSQV
jgi:hypothetical protein